MSFPLYPAYKDAGMEWLGDVPERWLDPHEASWLQRTCDVHFGPSHLPAQNPAAVYRG